jgi:hypothetical protein
VCLNFWYCLPLENSGHPQEGQMLCFWNKCHQLHLPSMAYCPTPSQPLEFFQVCHWSCRDGHFQSSLYQLRSKKQAQIWDFFSCKQLKPEFKLMQIVAALQTYVTSRARCLSLAIVASSSASAMSMSNKSKLTTEFLINDETEDSQVEVLARRQQRYIVMIKFRP